MYDLPHNLRKLGNFEKIFEKAETDGKSPAGQSRANF